MLIVPLSGWAVGGASVGATVGAATVAGAAGWVGQEQRWAWLLLGFTGSEGHRPHYDQAQQFEEYIFHFSSEISRLYYKVYSTSRLLTDEKG